MWKLTYKWATYSHPNKSKRWVVKRYFGMFNRSRRDKWVFGDRASGVYCSSSPGHGSSDTSWSPARHLPTTPPCRVLGRTAAQDLHPDDRQGPMAPLQDPARSLPLCGTGSSPPRPATNPTRWERWLATNRKTIKIAMHTTVRRKANLISYTHTATAAHRQHDNGQHFCPPTSPRGLLEPDAVKVARPVLRGAGAAMRPSRGSYCSLCHGVGGSYCCPPAPNV